jgi:hypothetical protein
MPKLEMPLFEEPNDGGRYCCASGLHVEGVARRIRGQGAALLEHLSPFTMTSNSLCASLGEWQRLNVSFMRLVHITTEVVPQRG